MSQCDTTETFGLPFRTINDLRGLRFVDTGGDGTGAGGDADAENTPDDEQGSSAGDESSEAQGADGDQDDDEGFDGDFDAKRARRTIDRLRRERNAARDAAKNAKNDPEMTKLQAENLRLRVAMKVGLDDDLADRLRGTTEEELLEDAQKLLDRFYPADKQDKLPTRQPKPVLKGGSNPDAEPEMSPDDIVKKALGR